MTDFERILKAQANTIQFVMDRIFGGTVVAMDPMNLNPVAVDEHRTGGEEIAAEVTDREIQDALSGGSCQFQTWTRERGWHDVGVRLVLGTCPRGTMRVQKSELLPDADAILRVIESAVIGRDVDSTVQELTEGLKGAIVEART